MIRLTREIRFSLPVQATAVQRPVLNSWAGWPSAQLRTPTVVLRTTLRGTIDRQSGYLCNIKQIDEAVRQDVVSEIVRNAVEIKDASAFLRFARQQLQKKFPPPFDVEQITLCVTPWLSWTLSGESASMILLTQQFEFSAAHRLHNPELSDARNLALFGKCNNPHGHGHNYLIDVTVAVDDLSAESEGNTVAELESLVRSRIVDRVDHRHLNVEVTEFMTVNPTVENIAVVFWNWLKEGSLPGTLRNVRVYETAKTWADYCGS
jgi:6-pyruvoyltetrahydropterin/6-carboxytetrahydropterin synthase